MASSDGKGDGYLFSMNDLCAIDHLAAVRDAGVISLKIEGRLKSVEYVRNTVRAYRLALDGLLASPARREEMLTEARRCLDSAMGRRRSAGFLLPDLRQPLIAPRLSGNTGEMVGRVTRLEQRKGGDAVSAVLQVALQAEIHRGDRLRLYDERSDERKSFTLRRIEIGGKEKAQGMPGQTVLMEAMGLETGHLRQPFSGLLFRVDVSGRAETAGTVLSRAVAAQRLSARDPARIDTLLTELIPGNKRGESKAASGRGRRSKRGHQDASWPSSRPQWWLKVSGLDILGHRLPFTPTAYLVECNPTTLERYRLLQQRARSKSVQLVWTLPPVILEKRLEWYQQTIRELQRAGETRFQIGHCSQVGLFAVDAGQPGKNIEIYGDYSLNLLNSAALRQVASMGLSATQFSLETDRSTLITAIADMPAPNGISDSGRRLRIGLLLYGRPPLFTARLDAPHFHGQRGFSSPRGERYYLHRGEDVVHVRPRVAFSLLAQANDLAGIGLDYFVVDISQGQARRECAEVAALLSGRGVLPEVFSGNYGGNLL